MLFLAVLGGAAVLEVHRARQNGNGDVKQLREKEAALQRQLQVGSAQQAAVDLWLCTLLWLLAGWLTLQHSSITWPCD